MKNIKVSNLATTGMFLAIMLMMAVVPYVGFIQLGGGIGFTTMHAVVILATLLVPTDRRLKAGIIFGTLFGLSSWMTAAYRATPMELVFQNPLVSVLPRIIFGAVIAVTSIALAKVIKKEKIVYITTAIIATITHTLLVLGAMQIFGSSMYDGIIAWIFINSSVNVMFEVLVAIWLSLAVIRLREVIKL